MVSYNCITFSHEVFLAVEENLKEYAISRAFKFHHKGCF